MRVPGYSGSAPRVARPLARIACFAVLAMSVAGCASVSVPLGGLFAETRTTEPMTTGTVRAVPAERIPSQNLPPPAIRAAAVSPDTRDLSPEDREIVRATLDRAMLESERAVRVPWLNARSGRGGLIVPVGALARRGEARCRTVLVSSGEGSETRWQEAEACSTGAGWALQDLRPFRNPA